MLVLDLHYSSSLAQNLLLINKQIFFLFQIIMRFTILILFLCLLNISVLKADDDDIDEDLTIDDTPITKSSANIEKGNVPTIKSASSNIYFEEQFQEKSKWSHWIKSQAKKDGVDESLAKYDGEWGFEIPQSSVYNDDYALILKVTK
jgi:calnexin